MGAHADLTQAWHSTRDFDSGEWKWYTHLTSTHNEQGRQYRHNMAGNTSIACDEGDHLTGRNGCIVYDSPVHMPPGDTPGHPSRGFPKLETGECLGVHLAHNTHLMGFTLKWHAPMQRRRERMENGTGRKCSTNSAANLVRAHHLCPLNNFRQRWTPMCGGIAHDDCHHLTLTSQTVAPSMPSMTLSTPARQPASSRPRCWRLALPPLPGEPPRACSSLAATNCM